MKNKIYKFSITAFSVIALFLIAFGQYDVPNTSFGDAFRNIFMNDQWQIQGMDVYKSHQILNIRLNVIILVIFAILVWLNGRRFAIINKGLSISFIVYTILYKTIFIKSFFYNPKGGDWLIFYNFTDTLFGGIIPLLIMILCILYVKHEKCAIANEKIN